MKSIKKNDPLYKLAQEIIESKGYLNEKNLINIYHQCLLDLTEYIRQEVHEKTLGLNNSSKHNTIETLFSTINEQFEQDLQQIVHELKRAS